MITYAKETSGLDYGAQTFIDEVIARTLKYCHKDKGQNTKADFRVLINAQTVFRIYHEIKARGGISNVYPSTRQPSVTGTLADFIRACPRTRYWRGLNYEELRMVARLRQTWIRWLGDESSSSEPDSPVCKTRYEEDKLMAATRRKINRQEMERMIQEESRRVLTTPTVG